MNEHCGSQNMCKIQSDSDTEIDDETEYYPNNVAEIIEHFENVIQQTNRVQMEKLRGKKD